MSSSRLRTNTVQSGANGASSAAAVDPTESRFSPGELSRISGAEPVCIRTVIKLDQRSMVWAYDGLATDVEALGPFLALIFIVSGFFCLYGLWDVLFGTDFSDQTTFIKSTLLAVLLLIAALAFGAAIYFLRISLFSKYGDIHFNRHAGTIYSAENNISIQMDWKHVRPFALANFGSPQLGAPILMSLQLVEFEPGNSNKPRCWLTVAGPLPSRQGCLEVWELIRRYMEDAPERMPRLEVSAGNRDWVSVLLAFGPMSFGTVPQRFLAKLRARNWWPPINPLHIIWWTAVWFFPLSVTLYNKYRRSAKFPAAWSVDEVPLPGERNPYQKSGGNEADQAGRRRAAWIIGMVSGTCMLVGIYLWSVALRIILE